MYDVVVIGCGPGGYAAAIRASQLGGKVAVVEAGDIGGICVNRGCIPTKVWLRAAQLLHYIRGAEDFGIKASVEELNLYTIVTRKDQIVGDIRLGMESLLKNNGVELIRGMAALKSPREVKVENTTLEAEKFILATGSRLDIPDVPGLEEAALTTDQVLEMTEVPSSVLILGSGPIEAEMATLLNAFGSKVYMALGGPSVLPREDRTASQWITQSLKQQGVELFRRFTLESVRKSKKGFEAILSGREERTVVVENILLSSRKPNTEDLGLDTVGVVLNDDGSVRVNEKLETSVEGIYAIGDLTGGWMLAHASEAMGLTAAENAMGQEKTFQSLLIPRGIWTIPQVGAVGLSEKEAKKQGIEFDLGEFAYTASGAAMARNDVEGGVKIISDAQYGDILGVHIIGANATELVGEAVLAMQIECTVEELANSIRVHPTFTEAVLEAARDAEKRALYLRKR